MWNWRKILARVWPWHARRRVASQLRDAAREARAEGRLRDAGVLYAASLRYENDPRIAVQAGHMYKESDDWSRAEHHYLRALERLSSDADLALQLGHFYKVSGDTGEAVRWYRRAEALAPGWDEPRRELFELGGMMPSRGAPDGADDEDAPVPELLPDRRTRAALPPGRIIIRQFGSAPQSGEPDHAVTLIGVDCIRGVCVSPLPVLCAELLIDGRPIASIETVVGAADAAGRYKHVFNLWVDVSPLPIGTSRLEIRLVGERGVAHRLKRDVFIGAGLDERSCPDSDGVVDPPGSDGDPTAAIMSRPSMVRSARTRFLEHPPRAILVVRADQLGDMVVSVPAIRRLRELAPTARLVGLVTRANEGVARALGLFDDLEILEWAPAAGTTDRRITAGEQRRLRDSLAAYRFDVAIDLVLNGETRPLLKLSGAPCLVGFTSSAAPWLTVSLDSRTHDVKTGHERASHGGRLLALVERFGTLIQKSGAVATLPPAAAERLERFGLQGRRYVVLHAGGRQADLRWPGMPGLAARLLAETDLHIVLFADAATAAEAPEDPRIILLQGELAYDDFDALLAFADVFVGNDSGPKHLAALRGTRTISIHSARIDWREWAQTQNGLVISRRVPCAGCGLHAEQEDECGRGYACVTDIGVGEVMDAVSTLLADHDQVHG